LVKINYMRSGIYYILFVIACVGCSLWFDSCSVARRIDWHEKQLDKYEKLYPEMFTTAGIDSLIKARALELVGQMQVETDQKKLDSLEYELWKLDKLIGTIKDTVPCDSILKYVERKVEVQGKQKVIYREATCKLDTVSKDSAGVHVRAWGRDGKLYLKLSVDSTRIKFDCPPEPICLDKEWFDFWQSKLAVALLVLAVGFVVARWKS
jgi:hypothetical protein